MRNDVAWILELDIHAGREDDFRALMAEMVSATEANEPGARAYEWSTSEDGKTCHTFERYADSAAAMAHIGAFGETYAVRFFEVLKLTRIVVYGSPSAEVVNALAGFNPVYLKPAAGFRR